jgi:hypothetical protein
MSKISIIIRNWTIAYKEYTTPFFQSLAGKVHSFSARIEDTILDAKLSCNAIYNHIQKERISFKYTESSQIKLEATAWSI